MLERLLNFLDFFKKMSSSSVAQRIPGSLKLISCRPRRKFLIEFSSPLFETLTVLIQSELIVWGRT
jgi:hypothetical protein